MDEVEEAIRKIRNGVFVITFSLDGINYGITTAWVNRASFKPNVIMVSIGKKRKGYNELIESENFCINILGKEHLDIARHFGHSNGKNVTDFSDIEYGEMPNGSVFLKKCTRVIDCKLVKMVDLGDHAVLFGEVLDGINKEGESFVFNRDFPS